MAEWTPKDERQYEHIKQSVEERGEREEKAEEIAARTVNKQRRKEGRTPNKTTQGTGNPRRPLEERTKQELYNLARQHHIQGRSKMHKADLIAAIQAQQSRDLTSARA
jgi:plasmid stabilization system protein ParE